MVYITEAPPDAINWLSISDAKALGINVVVLPPAGPREIRPSPAPAPTRTAPPPSQPSPPQNSLIALEASAKAFATTYFAHWSENNADALRFFGHAYAEMINFYDHPVSRELLIDEKRKFAVRWPERIYTTHPSTLRANCNRRTSTCTITGQVEWDCRDPPRGLRSVGLADFTLQVSMADAENVKVTGEWSTVLSKRE